MPEIAAAGKQWAERKLQRSLTCNQAHEVISQLGGRIAEVRSAKKLPETR